MFFFHIYNHITDDKISADDIFRRIWIEIESAPAGAMALKSSGRSNHAGQLIFKLWVEWTIMAFIHVVVGICEYKLVSAQPGNDAQLYLKTRRTETLRIFSNLD